MGGGFMAVKFGWPKTTVAFASLVAGIGFQMSTRLLSVSATTRMLPSLATPVGVRSPLATGAGVVAVLELLIPELTKSGWPTTTSAPRVSGPMHTGQRMPCVISAVGGMMKLETLL